MSDRTTSKRSCDAEAVMQKEFDELRQLLLGVEQMQLGELRQRLEELPADMLQIRSGDLSRILPDAIAHRSKQDSQLIEALLPPVEEAIRASVNRDPRPLADALFPVMMPAIRKAISQALNQMVQSINQTLEKGLSPESVQWRVEAWRTGRPFGEIVLLHTLLYRVEQVFLIHRETGLLLQHVVAKGVQTQDAEIVSGMLTAIQDFVHDSFGGDETESLDTVKVGELNLWIEAGAQAVLAGLIRGNAPQDLRLLFQEMLSAIQVRYGNELSRFQGETAPFAETRPHLNECLAVQIRSPNRRSFPMVWVIAAVLLLALGSWGFLSLRANRRWHRYLVALDREPGIVVTQARREGGQYIVGGLRDPFAKEPLLLAEQSDLDSQQLSFQWEEYQDLGSEFVTARAQAMLNPPSTVELRLEQRVLYASGHAPSEWVVDVRRFARLIPGVTAFNDEGLMTTALWKAKQISQRIEKQSLRFAKNTTDILPEQESVITQLITDLKELGQLTENMGYYLAVEILGHTDSTGPQELNQQLSQMRAEATLSRLVSDGAPITNAVLRGIYPTETTPGDIPEEEQAQNRCASLRIDLIPQTEVQEP